MVHPSCRLAFLVKFYKYSWYWQLTQDDERFQTTIFPSKSVPINKQQHTLIL